MAASTKLILRTDKQRKDGTCPVYLRITKDRKKRYISTGVKIKPRYWNENKEQVRASHEIAPALNRKLQELLLSARTEVLEAKTAKAAKEAVTGGGGDLTKYFQRFVDRLKASDQYWEWKKYRVTLGKLKKALGEHIEWSELDQDALASFERYVSKTLGNNPNTTRKEFTRLGRVVKQAVKEGVIRPDQNPLLYYDKPKGTKPQRRKLSIEEVNKLKDIDLEAESWTRLARDAFLVAFYCGGMRFGDVCRLKSSSFEETPTGTRLRYRMMKTGTPVDLPLPPPAASILEPYLEEADPEAESDDYVFPFLEAGDENDPNQLRRRIASSNTMVNRHLKEAAEAAGLKAKGLSMHVARHSFADYARRQGGDLYAISKALGHSHLQTTQQYLKQFDRDSVDRLSDDLWGSNES